MLSVIVPATDSPPTLGACVEALRAALPPDGEILVVDGPPGAGPAAARNLGALRARGELLAFCDADVLVEPPALERIARRFEADPGLGALFGAYDDRPAARGGISRFRNLLHHHVHVQGEGPAETFWAGIGAVRRESFEAAGGFDAIRYPRPAIEDVELGARLRDRGERIELDPAVRGTHLKRWTLASMVATDFARRGVPWVRLQAERRRPSSSLNLAPRQVLAALGAGAAALGAARRRPGAALAGGAVMVASNTGFYRLLARRGGARLAVAGVALHTVHHLTAIASVPAGLAAHAWASRARSRG